MSDNSSTNNGAGKQDNAGLLAAALFTALVGLYASLLVGWIVFPALLYSKQEQPVQFNHLLHTDLVDDSCQSCHFFREDGSFAGVPPLENCMECHEEMQGEEESERKLIEEYIEPEKEIPWLIYSKQQPCVFFSHAAHVFSPKMKDYGIGDVDDYLAELEHGEVLHVEEDEHGDVEVVEEEIEGDDEGWADGSKCAICHGPVGTSESMKPYQANRITGLSRDIWGENIAGMKQNTWDRMKMKDCSDCHLKAKRRTRVEACFVCHK